MRLYHSLHTDTVLPPVVWATIAQVAALILTAALAWMGARIGLEYNAAVLLLIQGGLAAGITYSMRLPIWWALIQFCFVPALVVLSGLEVSPNWYLLAFVALALMFWTTFRTQVPLYLSRRRVWQTLDEYLPKKHGLRFVDLGSGVGGLVAYLAHQRPGSAFIGIECAPLPSAVGTMRTMNSPNATIRRGDLWSEPLGGYDVAFAYLSPVPMPDLWEKAKREMRPGSLFISYRFAIPGVSPSDIVELDDWGRTRLYVWRM